MMYQKAAKGCIVRMQQQSSPWLHVVPADVLRAIRLACKCLQVLQPPQVLHAETSLVSCDHSIPENYLRVSHIACKLHLQRASKQTRDQYRQSHLAVLRPAAVLQAGTSLESSGCSIKDIFELIT
jgi:hypothetical protein